MESIVLHKLGKLSVPFSNHIFHIPNVKFDSAFVRIKAELLYFAHFCAARLSCSFA